MLRGYPLRYLAAVGTGASAEDTGRAVPAALGGVVRRLARKHTIAATFETEHAGDVGHVHRMAYLRVIAVPAADPNDVEGVRHAFETRRRRRSEDRAAVGRW